MEWRAATPISLAAALFLGLLVLDFYGGAVDGLQTNYERFISRTSQERRILLSKEGSFTKTSASSESKEMLPSTVNSGRSLQTLISQHEHPEQQAQQASPGYVPRTYNGVRLGRNLRSNTFATKEHTHSNIGSENAAQHTTKDATGKVQIIQQDKSEHRHSQEKNSGRSLLIATALWEQQQEQKNRAERNEGRRSLQGTQALPKAGSSAQKSTQTPAVSSERRILSNHQMPSSSKSAKPQPPCFAQWTARLHPMDTKKSNGSIYGTVNLTLTSPSTLLFSFNVSGTHYPTAAVLKLNSNNKKQLTSAKLPLYFYGTANSTRNATLAASDASSPAAFQQILVRLGDGSFALDVAVRRSSSSSPTGLTGILKPVCALSQAASKAAAAPASPGASLTLQKCTYPGFSEAFTIPSGFNATDTLLQKCSTSPQSTAVATVLSMHQNFPGWTPGSTICLPKGCTKALASKQAGKASAERALGHASYGAPGSYGIYGPSGYGTGKAGGRVNGKYGAYGALYGGLYANPPSSGTLGAAPTAGNIASSGTSKASYRVPPPQGTPKGNPGSKPNIAASHNPRLAKPTTQAPSQTLSQSAPSLMLSRHGGGRTEGPSYSVAVPPGIFSGQPVTRPTVAASQNPKLGLPGAHAKTRTGDHTAEVPVSSGDRAMPPAGSMTMVAQPGKNQVEG